MITIKIVFIYTSFGEIFITGRINTPDNIHVKTLSLSNISTKLYRHNQRIMDS